MGAHFTSDENNVSEIKSCFEVELGWQFDERFEKVR